MLDSSGEVRRGEVGGGLLSDSSYCCRHQVSSRED